METECSTVHPIKEFSLVDGQTQTHHQQQQQPPERVFLSCPDHLQEFMRVVESGETSAVASHLHDLHTGELHGYLHFAGGTHGQTALGHCAKLGDLPTAKLLLSHGANVNARDLHGNTPLHLSQGNFEMQKLLLEHGASPDSRNLAGALPNTFPEHVGPPRNGVLWLHIVSLHCKSAIAGERRAQHGEWIVHVGDGDDEVRSRTFVAEADSPEVLRIHFELLLPIRDAQVVPIRVLRRRAFLRHLECVYDGNVLSRLFLRKTHSVLISLQGMGQGAEMRLEGWVRPMGAALQHEFGSSAATLPMSIAPVQITVASSVVAAPQVLRGAVIVDVSSGRRALHGELTLYCDAKRLVNIGGALEDEECEKVLQKHFALLHQQELEPGRHVLPFSIDLPAKELPSSWGHRAVGACWIEWGLCVKVAMSKMHGRKRKEMVAKHGIHVMSCPGSKGHVSKEDVAEQDGVRLWISLKGRVIDFAVSGSFASVVKVYRVVHFGGLYPGTETTELASSKEQKGQLVLKRSILPTIDEQHTNKLWRTEDFVCVQQNDENSSSLHCKCKIPIAFV